MTLDDARALDAADPLASARQRFRLPPGVIYLDGNSLGALPEQTPARLAEVVEDQWGTDLITSWNTHDWIDAPSRVAAKLAPIVGATPDELVVADSTSVLLYKALSAAISAKPGRHRIVARADEFPTDLYIAQAVAEQTGCTVTLAEHSELADALGDDAAVLLLGHVHYRSGQRYDLAEWNARAHKSGAMTVWDLSHSAGAIAMALTDTKCDLAVGCGYKFLNGGPGAPAFLFAARRLHNQLTSPIPGWMGHVDPFAFDPAYAPAAGIRRFLSGTPSILALAALDCGLKTFEGVAMRDVEAKSAALATLFLDQIEARIGIDGSSQRDRRTLGSHVILEHPHGFAVMQALIARGVIGDFRPPNLMRFGFTPLILRFEDVWNAAEALGQVLASSEWDQPRFHARGKVT